MRGAAASKWSQACTGRSGQARGGRGRAAGRADRAGRGFVEVGLQVSGADAVEDVELPTLEGGDHDVRPGQQLGGGMRRGLYVPLVQVAGVGQRPVGSPAVNLDDAAELDRRAGGLGQGLGADVVDHAQVGATEAALRRLLSRHRDQRLALRGAAALAAASLAAADQRLIEFDHAAQQQLMLAAAHGVRDLAAQQPGRLGHPAGSARRGAAVTPCRRPAAYVAGSPSPARSRPPTNLCCRPSCRPAPPPARPCRW